MQDIIQNYTPKSSFLKKLKERGFLYQCSNIEALDNKLLESNQKCYIGFDCTAKSLHIGGLTQIMMLKYFQEAGHTPYILLGAGTTKIGDPTGKDKTRKMLSDAEIEENMQGIKSVFGKFLDLDKVVFVNNNDWLKDIHFLDMLREYGPYFTINRMLTFDSVTSRLERENPLTLLEFNYMVLQAMDFAILNQKHGVCLQMGGSDQWGNIINGVELNKKMHQTEVFGLTSPLLVNANGVKMGKTVDGAMWLSEDMLSPYDYFQYFRNVDDKDVTKLLKLFTLLSLEEIEELSKLEGKDINKAKIILATEATKLCHGEETAQEVAKLAENTFLHKKLDDNLKTFNLAKQELENGKELIDILIELDQTPSKSQARRLIDNGGLRVNDEKCENYDFKLSLDHFNEDGIAKISLSKKKHFLIKI